MKYIFVMMMIIYTTMTSSQTVNTADPISIYLNKRTTELDEVIITAGKKSMVLGSLKKSGSQTRIISKVDNFALLFSNPKNKESIATTLFLNLKEVPCKSDLVFNFYKTDTVERVYTNQKTNVKTVLCEVIPNVNEKITTLAFTLKPNPEKQIIEVDLASLGLKVPPSGIFVSVYTQNIYDAAGNTITATPLGKLPLLYRHKTDENNYCGLAPLKDVHWTNSNQIMRHHEDTDDMRPLFPMKYYEPSIALKIEN